MRSSRAGLSDRPSQLQVLRTGNAAIRPPVAADDLPVNTILVGDCVEELEALPPASIDFIFADPPYNLQLENALTRPDQSLVDAVDDDWDKFSDFAEYDTFTRSWLTAARRVMKREATIVVIGSYHNIFRVGAILQNLGFWILNDIVWRKANPMPNFRGRRFTNAHETMIWAARSADAKAYTFNYEALKAGNDDCQARSDWFFPICTGAERLKDDSGRKTHPTQKPEALHRQNTPRGDPSRRPGARPLLRLGHDGRRGEKRLRRNFLGVERDPAYAAAARKRIDAVEPLPEDAVAPLPSKRSEPRVAFASVIEAGLVAPGKSLYDASRRCRALVRADGALTLGPAIGSIHKIGALAQGLPACNGWTFWHVERAGKLALIDDLRASMRAAMRQAAE